MESLPSSRRRLTLCEALDALEGQEPRDDLRIASVLGMFAAHSPVLANEILRLESFRDAEDLINHLVGGALMVSAGVLALAAPSAREYRAFPRSRSARSFAFSPSSPARRSR